MRKLIFVIPRIISKCNAAFTHCRSDKQVPNK